MDSNRQVATRQDNPIARLKQALNAESVQQQFKNALKENASLFMASLIDVYGSDKYLQNCAPSEVIMEALKAATLKLPINKSLGFAYIVPYKNRRLQKFIPTMIIGYKGYLQLAQRTAQYKHINADAVYEGEKIDLDRLTGEIYFSGKPISEKAIGYFAFIETITGFRKTIFWTRSQVEAHAQKYSQSYHSDASPWKTNFDGMAIKTVLRNLLTKYGVMSIEMARASDMDTQEDEDIPAIASKPRATYDVTAKAPDRITAPTTTTEDEWGTPIDSPFEKSKWFNLKSGSFDKSTGFHFYVETNKDRLGEVSAKALIAMREKFISLYNGAPWPYENQSIKQPAQVQDNQQANQQETVATAENDNEVPWHEDGEQPTSQPTDPGAEVPLLETDAARMLAGLAQTHKREYVLVVKNQVPESIDQIYDWINQINEMRAANAQAHMTQAPTGDGEERF